MRLSRQKHLALLFVCCLFSVFQASAQDKDWRPISPQEMAMKTASVEPDADAEAIFWEVRVDDSSLTELALKHYVRAKIFTERGREQFSKRDIPFIKGTKIKDVDARVTKPDGSVVYLKKEDVLERDIIKANGIKVKAKSFALPGLEIGSIVEYRYREVVDNGSANMRLIFQRDLPIQNVTYYVKPFSGDKGMSYHPFNVGNTKFEKDKNGFHRATMTNVKAFHEEPNMLPEDDVRSWIYIYYTYATNIEKPEEYWKQISKAVYENTKGALKPNDDIKRATAETIAGATTDDEKLKKIYDYCKTQIKNVSYTANITDEEWKRVRESKSASETFKLKMGSPSDVDALFAAMARAAGFEARLALSGDRNEILFNPQVTNFGLMLNSSSIAIKTNDGWRFFSPGNYYASFGMLGWNGEDQHAIITDSSNLIWTKTPLSPPEKSKEKRTGKFRLLEDGTLVGEGRLEFTGHRAATQKNSNDEDSQTERENTLKNMIRRNIFGTAEIESLSIENATDPEKPFVYNFKIRVPGYASRTGKRLFFQPNVFERSSAPYFSSSSRKYDVYMSYPWSEEDSITIELPEGFALESPEAPGTVRDPQGISSDEIKMGITQDGKTLTYSRKFSFGNTGHLRFPAIGYAAVKALFEAFHKADTHQLTLRQGATASSAAPPPPVKNN